MPTPAKKRPHLVHLVLYLFVGYLLPPQIDRSPCASGSSVSRQTDKRECMGIEPTESFVQTLHRF